MSPAPLERVRAIRYRLRTPGRLVSVAVVAVVVLFLPFGALTVATGQARDALRVIGYDAGPQVVATTDLYYSLSDADAQVANVLLMGTDYQQPRRLALARYDQRRGEVGAALLRAHRLAGESAAEQRTIGSILEAYVRYERLAGRALLLAEQAGYPAGAPPAHVLDAYREATDLMSFQVLPQAYNLTLENGTTVRRTHDDARVAVLAGRTAVALGGGIGVAGLIWLQLYLTRRFRRLLNPALLVATVIVAAHAVTGLAVLTVASDQLRVAKEEGFDPVLSLARARAISNSLHADQVRYLIDPERADTYEQIYLDKAQSLVYVEAGNLSTYYAEVAELVAAESPRAPGLLAATTGGAAEVDRAGRETPAGAAASAGAADAAAATLAAYDRVQRADRELRRLAADGSTGEAVRTWFDSTGTAFDTYDTALVGLAAGYRADFDEAVADGDRTLDDLGILPLLAVLAGVTLIAGGVLPRLNEYR